MFESIYIKILASIFVVALVGGGYWYVKNLQNQLITVNRDNANLKISNDELSTALKDVKKDQENLEKIVAAGDKERARDKQTYREQLKGIDNGVQAGKDKPVGDLLKDFLNDR